MSRKAQSTLEYALTIVVVVGALVAVQAYVKRGVEGRLKSAADDIGTQYDIEVGGYHQRSELQDDKIEISISGDSALLTETGPGVGITKRYTQNKYNVITKVITTTDGEAALTW